MSGDARSEFRSANAVGGSGGSAAAAGSAAGPPGSGTAETQQQAQGAPRFARLQRISEPGQGRGQAESHSPQRFEGDGPPHGLRSLLTTSRWRWPLLALALCLVAGGITWGVWPSSPKTVPLHLVRGTVQASLLTPDQVSRLADTSLVSGARSNEPPAALSASPAVCSPVVGATTKSVYGSGWKAFLSVTYQDAAGTGDYTVSQVIGAYPSNASAGAAYRTLINGLYGCRTAVRTDPSGRTSKWAYRLTFVSPTAVGWTATQDGGSGWSCYHRAQQKGKAVLQVTVCEAGDGSSTAAAIAQRFAGQVSGS